ncbi:hypothetical protein WA026_003415 [Henosepilachna vigintioctopunctata]|uniref:RRM domain-containing protein n=1 Tax=Henosepilachna vigintioctopunctata TaxID=420089 RepID=A0AAW1THH2_9CUCU
MSDAFIDETILNDDIDDDLDYNIDPKEENALLQEESDVLDQDFNEDDILDLNIDYDQMDVSEDKTEYPERVKQENTLISNDNPLLEKKKVVQNFKNQTTQLKRVAKVQKRIFCKGNQGNASATRTIRRSKTLFINPRFGGPVHVNSRQFAWESPPPAVNKDYQKNQTYVQPWVTGNPQNQSLAQPQVSLNFNPSPFVPQSQQVMYMQPQPFQHTIQPVYQSFVPQPTPLMNQNVILNQQSNLQMNQCPNQYLFQTQPQMQVIQQVPEVSKIPVHQRLGVPADAFHSTTNISHPTNFEMQFNAQNFQNHKFVTDNQSSNQLMPQPFLTNQKMNSQKNFGRNQFNKKFSYNGNQNRHNNNRNQSNYKNFNNKVVTTRDSQFIAKNEKNNVVEGDEKKVDHKFELSYNGIIPEEDEEYQRLIEIQKIKREEVFRKKEENRLKSLAQKNIDHISTASVSKKVNLPVQKHISQKRFNYSNRTQQQGQQLKSQNYTNIIVITGNDEQSHCDQRFNKTLQTSANRFNNSAVSQPERTVTSHQVSVNANIQPQPQTSVNADNHSTVSPEFLSTRSVLAQDDLEKTNIVVVKNLASCTNEPKILKLCRDIGIVQKLQMEKAERQATIHFKTVASAHAFYKKFRRHMIDLSIIQVDLVPCEGSL